MERQPLAGGVQVMMLPKGALILAVALAFSACTPDGAKRDHDEIVKLRQEIEQLRRDQQKLGAGTGARFVPEAQVPTPAELGPLLYAGIRPELASIKVGQTQLFGMYGHFQNGKELALGTVEWRCLGDAAVDVEGQVTGVREGLAILTAAASSPTKQVMATLTPHIIR